METTFERFGFLADADDHDGRAVGLSALSVAAHPGVAGILAEMTAEVQAGGLLLAHHGAAGAAGIMLQTGECGSDTILDDYLLHPKTPSIHSARPSPWRLRPASK